MAEALTLSVERLEFDAIHVGDNIQITTGSGEQSAWQYEFNVDRTGRWPEGVLGATSPSGVAAKPHAFALFGCGRWTSRNENPVQKQERGFTPYYDRLIIGTLMWGRLMYNNPLYDKFNEMVVFGRPKSDAYFNPHPGDEISTIKHTPYRQNAVLNVLRNNGALSVSMVHEALSDAPIKLSSKNVRATLFDLVTHGKVSLLRKKVMLFEIES